MFKQNGAIADRADPKQQIIGNKAESGCLQARTCDGRTVSSQEEVVRRRC